jgi:hypothetical protein
VSAISKASLVDSAREKDAEMASNMNASSMRTGFVIVEAMLTNPPFLERDEVRAAPLRKPTTWCLLLGFFWDTEVIMVYANAYKNLIVVRLE